MLLNKSKVSLFIANNHYWLLIGLVKGFFLASGFLLPILVLAAPTVTTVTLNGQPSVTFNPEAGESLTINLSVSEPVKFSTIAICAVEIDDCTRTSAVKYFTQTSKYDTAVEKVWDGKKGGTAPDYVPLGNYRLAVTLAGQGGESDKAEIDLSNNLITVSNINSGSYESASTTPSDDNEDETEATSSPQTESSTTQTSHSASDFAVYSSYGPISSYASTPKLILSAGRARLALIGVPLEFRAIAKDYSGPVTYRFSFGDGTEGVGERVNHSYSFPGTYEVILTGSSQSEEVVTRTKVKVIAPAISIKEFSPHNHRLVLRNSGSEEVNVGDFRLAGIGGYQDLAKDTLIPPRADLNLYLNDSLVGSSNITLETKQGVKVVTGEKRVDPLITMAANSASSSLASVNSLEQEEVRLAAEWEKQQRIKADSKTLMIVKSSEKTKANVISEINSSATDTNSFPVGEKVVSPTLLPNSLGAMTERAGPKKPSVYQVNPPRSFLNRMVKWIDAIFHS